nr:helix-turn-helix domain-containing protein [Prevotella sp.]
MKYILSIVAALLISLNISAMDGLTTGYNMSCLNIMSGLPSNSVDDIFQDSYGFIWISTHGGGLVRYDGYGYMYMGVGNQGISLKSNFCRNVTEDNFHRLWVAFEEYVDVIDLQNMNPMSRSSFNICKTQSLTNQLNQILNQYAIRVYKDSKGFVWIATKVSVHRLSFDENGLVTNIQSVKYSNNAPDIAISDAFHDGSVFLCYNGSLHKIIVKNNKLVQIDYAKRLPQLNGLFVTDILRYQNKLWFATNSGLFCENTNGKVFHYDVHDGFLSHDFVTSLAVAPDGSLLIGTLLGVDILNPMTNKMRYWNMYTPITPLNSNFVNCIFSKNNQLWIGTETGGIVKLTPRELNITNYVHNTDPESLSPNAVNAMYVEPNGTLWVGNVEGGLSRKYKNENSFTHYRTGTSGLTHNSVSVISADNRSRLWIGTWAGGICYMDLRHPGVIHHLEVDKKMSTLLNFVGALIYDKINDGLWIGSNDGLFFYDFKTNKLVEPFDGCRNIRGCIGIIITQDKKLMVGCLEGMVEVNLKSHSDKGLFRWKQYKNKLDNPSSGVLDKITSFCQTKDGTLWLGSNGYGLYKRYFDGKGKAHYKAYTIVDGLVNNQVRGIAEDKNGLLWVTTVHGLSHLNPNTGIFTNYIEDDGLQSSQFYWNSAVSSPDGTVYLGSEQGLTAINGNNNKNIYKGNLRFTNLFVDNQLAVVGSKYLDKDITIAKEIYLHESDKSFTIEFSSLTYGNETQGVYSYRMKGVENEWIPLQPGQHSVRYSTLPSGNYEFQVKYSPDMTGKNDKVISIDVDVTPFFWKSWWFILILLVIAGVISRLLYVRRLKELHDKEVEKIYRPIEKALKESDEPGKLQNRIQTILNNQRKYVNSQKKTIEEDKKEQKKVVRPFIDEVTALMEAHYSDSNFGVTEFCDAMKMNRVTLGARLVEETGYPTSQFIRHYRLDIARRLLEENDADRNITEIAYKVGFNDPKYFSRCFTKEYGISPSSFLSDKG